MYRYKETSYLGVRLPEDIVILYYYMTLALEIKFRDDQPCNDITHLELLRMKLKLSKTEELIYVPYPKAVRPSTGFGCILRKRFWWDEKKFPGHECKVYRRVRWTNSNKTEKYKDWKVKILQHHEPKSMDYLVVHKLPVKLSEIEAYLRKTLSFELEYQCDPAPVKWMTWNIQ